MKTYKLNRPMLGFAFCFAVLPSPLIDSLIEGRWDWSHVPSGPVLFMFMVTTLICLYMSWVLRDKVYVPPPEHFDFESHMRTIHRHEFKKFLASQFFQLVAFLIFLVLFGGAVYLVSLLGNHS